MVQLDSHPFCPNELMGVDPFDLLGIDPNGPRLTGGQLRVVALRVVRLLHPDNLARPGAAPPAGNLLYTDVQANALFEWLSGRNDPVHLPRVDIDERAAQFYRHGLTDQGPVHRSRWAPQTARPVQDPLLYQPYAGYVAPAAAPPPPANRSGTSNRPRPTTGDFYKGKKSGMTGTTGRRTTGNPSPLNPDSDSDSVEYQGTRSTTGGYRGTGSGHREQFTRPAAYDPETPRSDRSYQPRSTTQKGATPSTGGTGVFGTGFEGTPTPMTGATGSSRAEQPPRRRQPGNTADQPRWSDRSTGDDNAGDTLQRPRRRQRPSDRSSGSNPPSSGRTDRSQPSPATTRPARAWTLQQLVQLAGDATGRRFMIGVVPALDPSGNPNPTGLPVFVVTAGNDARRRFRFQVLSRDVDGNRLSGAGQGNSIDYNSFRARGGQLLGRFAGATDGQIRDFATAFQDAGGPAADFTALPAADRSPARRSASPVRHTKRGDDRSRFAHLRKDDSDEDDDRDPLAGWGARPTGPPPANWPGRKEGGPGHGSTIRGG